MTQEDEYIGTVNMSGRTEKPVIIIGHHTINQLMAGQTVEIEAAIMLPASDLSTPTPAADLGGPHRWRVFEDITHGWWGIEEDVHDGNTILYPKKMMNRDPLEGIVRAHNAAIATPEVKP